jgi:hypothetical protein
MKKLIATMAMTAILASLTSPVFAEDFVPEGVDSSKGLTAAVVKDLPNGPAGSLVRNTSRVDKAGNDYFCKSTTTDGCDVSRSASLTIWQNLPVCSVSSVGSCVMDLKVYTAGEQPASARYVKNVAGDSFPGNDKIGLAAGSTPSIWESQAATISGGSQKFVVSSSIRWNYIAGKLTLQGFDAKVSAVQDVLDQNFLPWTIFIGQKNGKRINGVKTANSYSPLDCAATEMGYCAKVIDFADGTRVSLTLKLTKEVTGWLQGRLDKPLVSITNLGNGFNKVEVDASPVKVPELYAVVDDKSQPRWLQEQLGRWSNSGGDGAAGKEWRAFSSNGYQSVRFTNAIVKIAGDRASTVKSNWSVSSLRDVNTGNRCLDDSSRLIGLVTTNALAFDGGVPEFRNGFLSYQVAGAHYLPDGKTLSLGSYNLALRSETARCLYGFTKAPISGKVSVISAAGEKKFATTVVSEKDGWIKLAASGFTFSTTNIKVKLSQKR